MIKYFSEKLLTNIIYWLALLTAFTPSIYSNNIIFPYITAKVIIFRVIVSIMFFCYVLLILKDKKYLPPANGIIITFLFFILACLASGQFSHDPSQSFWSTAERMMGTLNMIYFFVFFLILSSIIATKELWHKLLNKWNIIIFSLSSLSFAIYILNHLTSGRNILNDRLFGFSGNPLFFAAIILVFFYVNFYLFFSKLQTAYKNRELWWHVFIGLMYIVFIIFTVSRGAFLSLGITGLTLLISLILNPNRNLHNWLKVDVQKVSLVILLVSISTIFCMFAFKNMPLLKNNPLANRLTTFNLSDASSLSRVFVTKVGLNCFIQKPLLGYGFDNFEICFQKNFDPMITNVLPNENRFDKAHNMPIEILATTGIVGFIFFIGMYSYGYKNVRDLMLTDSIDFYAGLSLILAIVAYFLQNLFMFDVFDGFLAFTLLLSFIAVLKNDHKVNINIPKSWFNPIICLTASLILFIIYQFNILTWYYGGFTKKIDHLINTGKADIAIDILKNTKIRFPYTETLYYGFFDTFIKNQKNITQKQLLNYYDITFENLKRLSDKYPYRARIYLIQLAHIAAKAINPQIGVNDQDVQKTLNIMHTIKQMGLRLSELDFYEIQILLNSKNPSDWALGKKLAEEYVELYSESGKFHWIYGVFLINKDKNILEGIKQLKISYEKNLVFESIDQLITTVSFLNKHNESKLAIEIINRYLPSNPNRFQIHMELARAYINLKDYQHGKEALNQANQVYLSQRVTHYSSAIEASLKDLQNQLNNLKNQP